jgi:serine protease Do
VIEQADEIKVNFPDGLTLTATVIGSDPKTDIALLKVEPKAPLRFVNFGDSDAIRVGDWVLAIGNPFGLGGSVSAGIVSARNRDISAGPYDDFIQTDAAINKGNSGGPMFNMAGEVLGIVSHFISKSGGFEGLGFAVAANVARELVIERGAPWHGIDGLFLSDDLVRILNLPGPGVLVQRVVPDSTGARLGLRGGFVKATIGERTVILGGDVIVKAQGVPIGEAPRLREQLRRVGPGDTLSVTIMREGRLQELSTVLPRP